MKRFSRIAALVAALLSGTLGLGAQTLVELKMVPTDSLVNYLRLNYDCKIFYAPDEDDKTMLTVKSDERSFPDAALKEIRSMGYSVSEYDGSVYVLRGQGFATALPEGYFSQAGDPDSELLYVDEHNVVASFQNKVYEIGDKLDKRTGGSGYVKGYVRSSKNGEVLVGVAVMGEKSFAMTDASGYYCVKLPVGENKLVFSGYSLDELELHLNVYGDGDLDVVMNETVLSLNAAVVSGDKTVSNHLNAQIGVERINVGLVKTIPAAFGEADIIRAVTSMPGVKTIGEAATGFNVRGGSVDQNLILFNDGIIYNPTHMFGIMSAFDTDVVSNAELYKSSIPAEYGGRISSVLDIRSRSGNSKKVSGSIGIGLLTSRAEIEGPLGSENTTFILGGRTTYSNWLLNLLPSNSGYAGGSAYFADANLGISHKINEKNSIQAYAYWSMDRFSFSGDTTYNYSNAAATLKYRRAISEKTNMVITGGYDRYWSSTDDESQDYRAYRYSSAVNDAYLKVNTKTLLSDAHSLSYGGEVVYTFLMPGEMEPLEGSDVTYKILDTQQGIQPSLYFSDSWTVNDKIILDMGARLSSYASLGENSKFYCYPEVRLSGKYSPLHNLSVKAGFNTMTQYIHLISNSTSMSPMDAWQLSDSRIRPQLGYQAAAGLFYTPIEGLDLSLEGYYKRTYRYLDYKSGATLIMNENLADELVETTGRAYGVELMAKKTGGKLTGWISYTYSRSRLKEMEDNGVDSINNGEWYNAPYDKPHDFKFVGNYKLTHRFSISCNVDYSTGRPVTIPIGKYIYGGGYRFAYSERNAYRIPDYFRLDLAMIIEPSHNLKKLTHFSMTFGCYNVTGRKNAYSVYYTTNGGDSISGHMISVFACPVPYVNFNQKF